MKSVAIVQSNYIPWKGYFDMIASVDEFILYDDMQYTRRDWRNRNLIKTPQGVQWLTVPVHVKGKFLQKIRETEIDGVQWQELHWKALSQNYRRADHFLEIAAWLEPLYLSGRYSHLTQLNRTLLEAVCLYLGIHTVISNSWDYPQIDGRSDRLAGLAVQAGATHYISGPAAKGYLESGPFDSNGIQVSWFDYSGYPPYSQQWGEFSHGVSILDMLFNCGRKSSQFMKFVDRRK